MIHPKSFLRVCAQVAFLYAFPLKPEELRGEIVALISGEEKLIEECKLLGSAEYIPAGVGGPFYIGPLGAEEVMCVWQTDLRKLSFQDFCEAAGIRPAWLGHLIDRGPDLVGDGTVDGENNYAIPICELRPGLLERLYPEATREVGDDDA